MKHYNSDDERFRGEVLNAAKAYIAKGWHVFPLHSIKADGECTCGKLACSDAGKHPRLSRGLKEASTDPQKIEEWFGPNAPLSNVGIVTGAVSGCTVLDIDTADVKALDGTRKHLTGKAPRTADESNHLASLAARNVASTETIQKINEANSQRGLRGMLERALAAIR